jgi:hypothetical protein
LHLRLGRDLSVQRDPSRRCRAIDFGLREPCIERGLESVAFPFFTLALGARDGFFMRGFAFCIADKG